MQTTQKHHDSAHIAQDIMKYQLTQFCKRNTQAIAIILKALLQGAKHYPKSTFQETQKDILQDSALFQDEIPNPSKTTPKDSAKKDSKKSSPLNIEG
ncbi:hypothetical protein LS70_004630 [Helicobacter sp. MIT 11-5569]|uniref:hypothetical protein n=1 Tax=Helicobacter sp. MIT 11-5569 TaxID=1548151 RepID=UPI00051F9E57|nr:hypothetical protein [Helicobacter sp. MIT 11-5569]TLD84093.1 hypothetical protein LS70_004630 [Helicobacter sp. MIT 11-5569]